MNQCAQCKKSYKPCKNASGCPKCAPNTKIAESEFRMPIEDKKNLIKELLGVKNDRLSSSHPGDA
jgi:hypothetical protein